MKAQLTLAQADIEKAIKEYVERNGWTTSGPVSLGHESYGDQRDQPMGTRYTATLLVEQKRSSG